jgi:Peptidase inhibitor family I36
MSRGVSRAPKGMPFFMYQKKLVGLMSLLLAALVVSASSGGAAAEGAPAGVATPEAGVPTIVGGSSNLVEKIEGSAESAFAPLSTSQCSPGTMCVWSNANFTGNFSQWPASDTGCHPHAGNPSLRSGWNRTSLRVRVGGRFFLEPTFFFSLEAQNPVTGEICFPR